MHLINRRSPHDVARHQRAMTPLYFQAPPRGAFFCRAGPAAKAAPVNADLNRLIRLQQLESAAEDARRKIADHPARIQALDARLQAARDCVASAKSQPRSRDGEAAGRREGSRQRSDPACQVQRPAPRSEDQSRIHGDAARNRDGTERHPCARRSDSRDHDGIDELNAEIKKSEAELKTAEKEVTAERAALDAEIAGLQKEIDRTSAERDKLVVEIDRGVLGIFETTAKGRKGVAVAEARDGLCTICHVRLRPQVFNEVRKNESIIQCDSCRRILYFVGDSEAPAPVPHA